MQGRTIIEENSTTKALQKWIYSVKRMRQRSEKYKANNIRSYLIESWYSKWIYSAKKIQSRLEKYRGNDIRGYCRERN